MPSTDISNESRTSLCHLSDKLFMHFKLNDKDHTPAFCDKYPDFLLRIQSSLCKCDKYFENYTGCQSSQFLIKYGVPQASLVDGTNLFSSGTKLRYF